MRKEQAREIGLFFLLGFMEERVALSAASRAIAQLKAENPDISRRDREPEMIPIADIIRVCRESWKTHRKQIHRNQPSDTPETVWQIPSALDLTTWTRYQKDAPDEDVMTVLFSLVLRVSDEELAEGFQTSTGTIRYRLGKGVRQLGLIARGPAPKSQPASGGRL
jgi:hypothetical protein